MYYGSQFSRTNFRKFTIAYQGPKFWNTLPAELRDESSKNVFKKNLHRFLVQQTNLPWIIFILLINNFFYSLVFFFFSCLILSIRNNF